MARLGRGRCSWLGFLSIVEDPGVELTRTDAVSVSESAKRELGLADESYSEPGLLGGRFRIHVDVLVLWSARASHSDL